MSTHLLKVFLLGFLLNALLLAVLLATPTSRGNLWVPEGEHSSNIWHGSDVLTYVSPARGFVERGVFGESLEPDYHRTVGLPAVMATLMLLFGEHWQLAFLVLSTFVCAAVYPSTVYIARSALGLGEREERYLLVFCVLSAMYLAMVPVFLTDMMFATMFVSGLALGVASVRRRSWRLALAQVAVFAAAAQIRPALLFYPPVHLLLLVAVAAQSVGLKDQRVRWIIGISGAMIIVVIALPTLRNLHNHDYIRPSDVPSHNLFNYMGKEVLRLAGDRQSFATMEGEVEAAASIAEADRLRVSYGLQIVREHPLCTARYLLLNGARLLAGNYWGQVGIFWGYHWRGGAARMGPQGEQYRGSRFLLAATVAWAAIYLLTWALFVRYLLVLVRERRWLMAIGLTLLVLSFLVPATMVRQGPRLRLPFEGVVVAGALGSLRTTRGVYRSKAQDQ